MDTRKAADTHNGILFSLKRKEILTQDTIWVSLEDTTRREINPTQKAKYYVAYPYWGTPRSRHVETESRRVAVGPGRGNKETESRRVAVGPGRGNKELVFTGHRVPVWEG